MHHDKKNLWCVPLDSGNILWCVPLDSDEFSFKGPKIFFFVNYPSTLQELFFY